MDLLQLTKEIINESTPLKANTIEVDWLYQEVTILGLAPEGGEGGNSGGRPSDDSAQTEVIDPENLPPSEPPDLSGDVDGGEGGSGEGGGGEKGSEESRKIKIGDVVQDMKTGEYGRVVNIHDNGDVDWEPVSKSELDDKGYLAQRAGGKSALYKTMHLKGVGNNELIG